MNKLLILIPQRYLAYFALALWGAFGYMLLHKTPYGVDEGAARALLLVWSVAEGIVSPIVTLGLPDFRTIFFAPVGYLWPGNIVAAKISTMIFMACAVWAIHRWRQDSGNSESALLASGLLMICPLLIDQIDMLSVAPYLIITFALGAWLDKIYRDLPRAFGGVYFSQIILCLVSVTLHPSGLAYPLSLMWAWHRNPLDVQHKKYFFSGIVFAVVLSLLLTMGWKHIEWFGNPIGSLSSTLLGSLGSEDMGIFRWLIGIGMFVAVLLVILRQHKQITDDFLGRTFLLAVIIGLLVSDETWGILTLSIFLYWGFPLLMQKRKNLAVGFWGQRGWVMLFFFIVSTAWMLSDKAKYQMLWSDNLSPRDSLIKTLSEYVGNLPNDVQLHNINANKTVRVASQWPGLTMLACRCDALPLPPSAKDSGSLYSMLKGVNYLIFNPQNSSNNTLSNNLATMEAGKVETVALQQGGVIVEVKHLQPAPILNP